MRYMKPCAQDHTTYDLSLVRPHVHSLSHQVTSALFLPLPEAPSKTPREKQLYKLSCSHTQSPRKVLCSTNTVWGPWCSTSVLSSLHSWGNLLSSEMEESITQGAQRPFSQNKPKMTTGPRKISGCPRKWAST